MRNWDGMGGDVDGDVSGDEAVWRDLIARYEMPAADAAMSWPERENLRTSPRDPSAHVTEAPPAPEPGLGQDEGRPPGSLGTADPGTADPGTAEAGAAGAGPADAGTAEAGAAETDATGNRAAQDFGTGTGNGTASGNDAAPGHGDRRASGTAADRTRVVRHATPVPRPSAPDAHPDEDEDDHYVPPPPPPLPRLDSVGKGAWAALFGGPAYLVVATFLSWSVSSWAALAAVTAFVGGFAVVILRMGDGPSRGDGPDNGAVV